jgi:uncharacterized membrane protein (UPF0182 family)
VARSFRLFLVFAALALLVGLPAIAGVYTDWLWFGEVGYRQVFVTEYTTRGWLFALGILGAFAALATNFTIALRTLPPAPIVWVGQPGVPVTLPSGARLGRLARLLAAAIALPFAFQAAAQWWSVQLWMHQAAFGHSDPILGYDIAFYVFTLPLLSGALTWLLTLLAFSLIGSILLYGLGGRIGLNARAGLFIGSDARRHLSVLIAAVFAILAAQAWLAPAQQLLEPSGLIFGASYADVAVRIPAARLLFGVSIVAAVMSLGSARGSLRPLLVAIGVYVVTSIGGEVVASAVQRFVVVPNEQARETPYMANNIAATLKAFGLDHVAERELTGDATLSAADIAANAATLTNVRLWDHQPLLDTFAQLQEIRPYYDFASVDNDRYTINGDYRQVMLSARELNSQALSNRTWINEHLTFTHGYGLTLGPVNQVTNEGLPMLFVKDLPPVSTADLVVTEPRIYFGELSNDYVFVGTRAPEFDYPRGDDNVTSHYAGTGGVLIDSTWRKLLFALRFRSQQVLFSNDIVETSRVLFHRRIDERLQEIAPFLRYEGDPYIVVAGGRLYWMEDAYTTSDSYPYSTPARNDVNYIRNSVKIVVDAYQGTTSFYLADPADPIAVAIGRAFPGLLQPLDQMPADLRAHIRYPHNLFAMQTAMFATYHMTNPAVFYNKEDQWELPSLDEDKEPMQPYYTIMRLPGETKAEFIQMVPLNPRRKDNLAAWIVAESDAPHYGRLIVFRFPKQKVVFGPRQVVSRINQDQTISPQITLWNQQGSEVIQGTLLVIPIEESLLYIRPLYLRSQGGKIPELKRVIVAYRDSIVMEPTLDAALARLFGETLERAAPAAAQPAATATSAKAPETADVNALVAEARTHFDRAIAAQRQGDWATYGEELKRLGEVLDRASARLPKR